jgi:uncharacterized protein YbaR (Trm112 family)
MISAELLKILVCPETKRPLNLADDGIVSSINDRIRQHTARSRTGEAVDSEIEGGLLTEDMRYLYPIRGGIPVMLSSQAIEL